ncbi:hypothetical protein APX70_01238, partial [Pseudomonas syringae pv. maculicola]
SEPAKDQPPSKPFPLRIGEIKLADGYVHFQDVRPSEPIEFLYDALNFELKNLSTLPEDNADMTLVAAGPDGGQIDWVGRISLVPITSEGTLKVTDGKMKLWWPYVRDALPLALENGVLNFSTAYKLDRCACNAWMSAKHRLIWPGNWSVSARFAARRSKPGQRAKSMANWTGKNCSPTRRASLPRRKNRQWTKRPLNRRLPPRHLRKPALSQASRGKCCYAMCNCATTRFT